MVWAILLIIGHFLAALIVYLNHRFVYHTKLGNLPILRDFKELHFLHHAHAYDEVRNEFILVPKTYQALILVFFISLAIFISFPLMVGFVSFAVLYSYRHYAIHNGDTTSSFYKHHHLHHKNAKCNYSGIYPFIDSIFRTRKTRAST